MWQTKFRTQKQQMNFVLNECVVWTGNLMETRRLEVFMRAEWWRRLSELKVVEVTFLRKYHVQWPEQVKKNVPEILIVLLLES